MKALSQMIGEKSHAGIEVKRHASGHAGHDRAYQFIHQKPVGLEERTCADSKGPVSALVQQRRLADGLLQLRQREAVTIRQSKQTDALQFGNTQLDITKEFLQTRSRSHSVGLKQERRVIMIHEEFNFADRLRDPPLFSQVPQVPDRAIDKRRTDRTFFYRQQLVRSQPPIAESKSVLRAQLHARAVAVVPKRIGVSNDFIEPFKLCRTPERFQQNGALDL